MTSKFPTTILVVDDDEGVQGLLKMFLEAQGHAVFLEKKADAAFERIKTTQLTAVLLDLHLHGETSFDLLEKIKLLKPTLPVIMVTGSMDETEARTCLEKGAWDYVTKPINLDYLKNILVFSAE